MSAPTMAEAIEIIRKPFHVAEVEWRIQRSGYSGEKIWAVAVPYITARAVHDRLDEAFGSTGWYNEFRVMEVPGGVSGVICRMNYLDPETAEWRYKENGAGQTHIEPFKGGLSDAEKRAFEQLGGGRYLYNLGDEFVEVADKRNEKFCNYARTPKPHDKVFYWAIPSLPDWAIPGVRKAVQEQGEEIFGEPVDEPLDYPLFDRVIASMTRRQGVAELRGAKSFAKELKMDDDTLVAFATSIGVDLHDLTKANCIKLRDMMREEKIKGGS